MRIAGASLALVVLAGVSAAGAARPGDALRAQARSLGNRANSALLDLYALDSRLHAAQLRVATLQSQVAALRREQVELSHQLHATTQTLVVSQNQLGRNLSTLYKEGDISALAVILGATSLDDALTRLDDLDRVAAQSRQVVAITTAAQTRVGRLRATIVERGATLNTALAAARQTAHELAAARVERAAFVADLRRQERMKVAQIRTLETTVQRVVVKADALQAAAVAAPADPAAPPAAAGGRTIVVTSTGYSLPGHTATGLPVAWGVVAVDPAVIPLGTRLTIPGYGDAVAADTGGAVRGNTVDLWFPTLAQAQLWGRRTITITLH